GMTIKRIVFILALLALGALLVGGIVNAQTGGTTPPTPGAGATPQATQNTPQQPTVSPTEGVTTFGSIAALGSVEPNTVAPLVFQTAGTVNGVYVQTGDYVQAGEVLADLDGVSAWSTYNQAVLNLQSANIAMAQLMEPPSEDDLKVAKANLASAQAAYG